MVYVVLLIGLVNIGLGFAIAIYLEHVTSGVRVEPEMEESLQPEDNDSLVDEMHRRVAEDKKASNDMPEVKPVSVDIPQEWIQILEKDAYVANSYVEASVHVLRLEVSKYREELIALEDEAMQANEKSGNWDDILTRLGKLNRNWLDSQQDAYTHLEENAASFGLFNNVGRLLVNTLEEQAEKINVLLDDIEALDFKDDYHQSRELLFGEIGDLVDLAHILRDRMHESLLEIMLAENRLKSIDHRLRFDSITNLHSAAGMAVVFKDWRDRDVDRQRTISLGLIDIDHALSMNRRCGAVAGDKIFRAFSNLLSELLSTRTGFEVFARYEKDTFLLFFGDSGPRGALSRVERVRQAMRHTTFEMPDGTEVKFTVSGAVTEVGRKEELGYVVKRLRRSLEEAKCKGKNATFIDEGRGPTRVPPPDFHVEKRTVMVRQFLYQNASDEEREAADTAYAEAMGSTAAPAPETDAPAPETASEEATSAS